MSKPKINPPFKSTDILFEGIAAIAVIYIIVQVIIEYPGLENEIVTHFDKAGKPDAWGNKTSFLILPIVVISLYAGLTFLNRYPHLFNYPVEITQENAHRQYQLAKSLIIFLKAGMLFIFGYIQYQTFSIAEGNSQGLGSFFIIAVMVVTFVPIIFYFACSIRNK